MERAERRRIVEDTTPPWIVLIGRLAGRPAAAIVPGGGGGFYFADDLEEVQRYPFMGDVTHEAAPAGFYMPPIRTNAPIAQTNYRLRCRPAARARG